MTLETTFLMTIAELIEKLKNFPQDQRVVISSDYGGVNDVLSAYETYIKPNVYVAWAHGKHQETNDPQNVPVVKIAP
jgi:hypothetical protein